MDDKLRREIPDYMLMPYHIPESALPVLLDTGGPFGYADGQANRRKRREQERLKKKQK